MCFKDFAYFSDVFPVLNERNSPVVGVACLFSVVLAKLKHYYEFKLPVFYSPK